jgi:hypothetical protein
LARTQSRSPTVRARRLTSDDRARSALAAAALGAVLVGLVGVEAGVLWVVAGVWTVRSVSGSSMGVGWGLACVAATMRWGTLSLGDVEVSTRLAGPTLLSGTSPVRASMAIALAGALLDEARIDGLRSGSRAEQVAAALASIALVALFLTGGPLEPFIEAVGGWATAAVIVALVTLFASRIAKRIPAWVPLVLGAAGLVGGALTT